jgi:hypothetical protein
LDLKKKKKKSVLPCWAAHSIFGQLREAGLT